MDSDFNFFFFFLRLQKKPLFAEWGKTKKEFHIQGDTQLGRTHTYTHKYTRGNTDLFSNISSPFSFSKKDENFEDIKKKLTISIKKINK